jgi:hypothetical protein
MGEVYQATDAKLGRSVVLKFLPEALAQDPERLARFTREAKTLASLNHPAVAAIHGLEEAESRSFLVMELVPGRTLDELIGGRPLPWNEALGIARQIAEALEAAHDEGIVHRDLKPGNVKVTPDGRVKVLDFGLAKLVAAQEQTVGGERVEVMSTITAPATRAGLLLGTPAYMAPEQAEGRSVDARADLFAFGCVLYEMLTGRRAFQGRSVAETLSLVLQRDPDWTQVPSEVPASLVRLLRLCLEKDPRKRRQSAGDVRVDLDHVDATPAAADAAVPRRASRAARLAWLAAAVAMTVVIAALAVPAVTHLREGSAREIRLQIVTPPTFNAQDFAVSPNGRSIVFAAQDPSDGQHRLHLRPLDQSEARPLPGTDGGRRPFWPPNNRSIGFFALGTPRSPLRSGGRCPERRTDQTGRWGRGVFRRAADRRSSRASREPRRDGVGRSPRQPLEPPARRRVGGQRARAVAGRPPARRRSHSRQQRDIWVLDLARDA